MPKSRQRKTPITHATDKATRSEILSSKPKSSRTVIRKFHNLLKIRTQLEQNFPINEPTIRLIDREMEDLGGLERYQHMSNIGQGTDRGGGSENVFIGWLKELDVHKASAQNKKRLLEIGALKPDNYKSCLSWIDPTPIDLHSRHPAIQEQDFLKLDPEQHAESWDLVSLSLVLNFVPDKSDRGRMLKLAHKIIVLNGYLFLALPLPCVTNSRYLTLEHLKSLMQAIGFQQISTRWRQGGKMAYWLYQKQTTINEPVPDVYKKKTILRTGNRNNFCICL